MLENVVWHLVADGAGIGLHTAGGGKHLKNSHLKAIHQIGAVMRSGEYRL